MTAKLDALGNVIPADQRPRIEAALAKKVPKVSAAEVTAFDLVYQEKFRAEHGECRGCYLSWPEGTEGVPPRPQFEDDGFAGVLAARPSKSSACSMIAAATALADHKNCRWITRSCAIVVMSYFSSSGRPRFPPRPFFCD